jgi:hypothetical protein
VGDTIGRPGEGLVFAPVHASYAAELAKVLPDGSIRQRGGDAGEADGGDGVAWRPSIDEGAAASRPREASSKAFEVSPVLVSSEENQPRGWDLGSGQISDTSSTDTQKSARRKSFLSSMVT